MKQRIAAALVGLTVAGGVAAAAAPAMATAAPAAAVASGHMKPDFYYEG